MEQSQIHQTPAFIYLVYGWIRNQYSGPHIGKFKEPSVLIVEMINDMEIGYNQRAPSNSSVPSNIKEMRALMEKDNNKWCLEYWTTKTIGRVNNAYESSNASVADAGEFPSFK